MSSKMVIETKKASEYIPYAVWEAGISPFLANWTLVYGKYIVHRGIGRCRWYGSSPQKRCAFEKNSLM